MEELDLGHRGQWVSISSMICEPSNAIRTQSCLPVVPNSHSFKLLPNIGKHIVELLEDTLAQDLAEEWRWRPGGDALKSRRAAPAKDLVDMPGWNHDAKL